MVDRAEGYKKGEQVTVWCGGATGSADAPDPPP